MRRHLSSGPLTRLWSAGAAVTSRRDWGSRITNKLIQWVMGRTQFLTGCWAEVSVPCHGGLSIELLMTGQLASAKMRHQGEGKRKRERERIRHRRSGLLRSNPSNDIPVLYAIGHTDEPWYIVGGAHTKG